MPNEALYWTGQKKGERNMGAWGTGLYQDDVTEDVKDAYKDRLHRGKQGEEITKELIEENIDILEDEEDAPLFWFALADTQWNMGRLEPFVKEKALEYLRTGKDLERWKREEPKDLKKRKKVLEKLEEKLLTEPPEKKKVSQYRIYHCPWENGDTFAYLLESQNAKDKNLYGKYLIIHKVNEDTWWPGHTIPVVHIKLTNENRIPTTNKEIDELEYIQTSSVLYKERFFGASGLYSLEEQIKGKSFEVDEYGYLPEYMISIITTSKRVIPKKLIYLGNYTDIKPPKPEFIPLTLMSLPTVTWKELEKKIIDRYFLYNKRELSIYHDKKSQQ